MVFNSSSSDKERFSLAIELSDQFIYVDKLESEYYLNEAKIIAKEMNNPAMLAEVDLQLFELLFYQEMNNECVELMISTIDFCKKNKLKSELGHAYNKLGSVYISIQLFDKALEYFVLANETFKENKDYESQKNSLNNIGAIYYYQDDLENAILYFEQSYEIEKLVGNNIGMAQALGNIGAMYCKMDPPNYKLAESTLFESLKIAQGLDNPKVLSASLNNLTYFFIQTEQLDKAEEYNEQALEISSTSELDNSLLKCLENKLEILRLQGDFENALDVAQEILDFTNDIYSVENTKALAELETVYQTKEKQKENELLKKQSEMDQVKLDYEQQKSFYLIFGLAIVAILGIFAFNRFLVSQKRKKVIERQKEQVEQQKELLHEQNEIVKEKNLEISDSITYAKRIQSAILPPIDALNYHLKDGFLIFKPKDIVSGDFYWMYAIHNRVYFAVADCTGHGVPGAMVSVVCNNALNRSIREFDLVNPGEILDKTRELVVENFSLNNGADSHEGTIKDGMDISLCILNQENNELMWAGANNPIWIIRKGEFIYENVKGEMLGEWGLYEISGDKQPVGAHEPSEPFTDHKFELKKGDQIMVFSDGYADQFGGERGKKLKYRPFKQLLLQNAKERMEIQKERLETFFEEWKGDYEQIDDVCVIGVRI
ncbi:MAG: tetratricopeptide repeat protein [Flavobacteriales bacterium]|nr:tetratricopeptide repeat protein [Flavobacteriales bacterium]